MTVSHVFFAVVTTAYILVAIQFEERDLMREHPEYSVYRDQVPMLLPRLSTSVTLGQDQNTGQQKHPLHPEICRQTNV
jgi:cell division protein FtsL